MSAGKDLKKLNSHHYECRPTWNLIHKLPMYRKCPKSKLSKSINLLSVPTTAINSTDVLIILGKSKDFLKISPNILKKMNKKLVIIDPNNFCSHFEKIYKNK